MCVCTYIMHTTKNKMKKKYILNCMKKKRYKWEIGKGVKVEKLIYIPKKREMPGKDCTSI